MKSQTVARLLALNKQFYQTFGHEFSSTRVRLQPGVLRVVDSLASDESILDLGCGNGELARELMPVPVIGLAEASMLTACMLGRRFSIVSFARALGPWFRECVAAHGLNERLASIRLLDDPFAAVGRVGEDKEDLLVALAGRAVAEDEADVIVLAGAPLAGLAARVRDRVPVPVVEGVAAAIRQAELLISLDPRKAVAGTYRRPDAKSSIGLPAPLARLIAHADA